MNTNNNQNFESMLKSKMDELASSVDCFDKISRRAFPEISPEQEEHEIVVTGLENVTGKKRRFRFAPVAAIAAAASIALFVIPNTGLKEFVSSNLGGSDKEVFRQLINEIKEETQNENYEFFDVSLDDYIKYDRIITPLYDCPFESINKDNINVRIFVKTHQGLHTNQVYAVEYEGNYSGGNYIAAADSQVKITTEELESIKFIPDRTSDTFFTSPSYSSFSINHDTLTNKENEPVLAAEYTYTFIGKNSSGVNSYIADTLYSRAYNSESYDIDSVLYGLDSNEAPYAFPSDIYSFERWDVSNTNEPVRFYPFDKDSEYYTSIMESGWNNSVYYSGEPAMTEENDSAFTEKSMFAVHYELNSFPSFYADLSDLGKESLNMLTYSCGENNVDFPAPFKSSGFRVILAEYAESATISDAENNIISELTVKPFSSTGKIYEMYTGSKNYNGLGSVYKNGPAESELVPPEDIEDIEIQSRINSVITFLVPYRETLKNVETKFYSVISTPEYDSQSSWDKQLTDMKQEVESLRYSVKYDLYFVEKCSPDENELISSLDKLMNDCDKLIESINHAYNSIAPAYFQNTPSEEIALIEQERIEIEIMEQERIEQERLEQNNQ